MDIAVIGSGYVGLVVAACLSGTGRSVICADKDKEKILSLQSGTPTIYEPGLTDLLREGLQDKRLSFTTDLTEVIHRSEIIFITAGTPPTADGLVNMEAILDICNVIARHATRPKIVVMKSTVPVGTYRRLTDLFATKVTAPIDYVANPEFLKEGHAIEDFTKPDRVVIGSMCHRAADSVAELYMPFMRQSQRIIFTDPTSAEIAKYASNAMLALRISFINEIAQICDVWGADVADVRRCVGSDQRIGPAFLFPGLGYGGHCLPKDVVALARQGAENNLALDVINAIHTTNQQQVPRFLNLVLAHYGGEILGKRFAVWGLAYKARTDDVRESPAIRTVEELLKHGASVTVYGPEAMGKARAVLGQRVTYAPKMYDALAGADALMVLTDWQLFRNPDFEILRKRLAAPVIFDGRNLLSRKVLEELGFYYYCIGRPPVIPSSD